MSAEKAGLRALVSAAMLGGIITVRFRVIEKSPGRERRASPGVCERLAFFERDPPPEAGWFFGNNFRSELFTCRKLGRGLQTDHTKLSPARLSGPIPRRDAPPGVRGLLCLGITEVPPELPPLSPEVPPAPPAPEVPPREARLRFDYEVVFWLCGMTHMVTL